MTHGELIGRTRASAGLPVLVVGLLAAAPLGAEAVRIVPTLDPFPGSAKSTEIMHARYFSPILGRFLSIDPVGGEVGSSQSWNRYSYVLNNPVTFVDPTGMQEDVEEEVADEGFWKRLWDKIVGKAAPTRATSESDLQESAELAEAAGLNPDTSQTQMVGLEGASAFANGTREAIATLGAELTEEAVYGLAFGAASKVGGALFRLGRHKSAGKWARQMEKRGWTRDQIKEAIELGERHTAVNLVNPGNRATRYVHPGTRRSVVIDDVTKEVIHVGGDGFKY